MRMKVVMLSELKVVLHRLSFGDSQVELVIVLSWMSNTGRPTSPQVRGRWRSSFLQQNKNVDANSSSGTTQGTGNSCEKETPNSATY